MDDYGIYDTLTDLKNSRNWSYYRFAKESGLPESTVANVFKRKTLPQIDTLFCLCKGFGIDFSHFFCDDEKYRKLSSEEKEALKLWDSLNSNNQKLVKELMGQLQGKQ